MAIEPLLRRFTTGEYHCMAEAGIFCEDDRVELVDGEIIQMSPIGGRHVSCVSRLDSLIQRLDTGVTVNIQSPVHLGEYSEPQPDVAVVRARKYGAELPGPADVLLLIEVSDTTLRYDRGTKLPLYAGAGIPEVWLVDLPDEAIERHTNPVEGSYRVALRVGRGEEIESLAVPGLIFDVDEVLGHDE